MSYVESTVDLGADIIDVRDIIARVEELRDGRDLEEELADDDAAELGMLEGILAELAGYGGDEEFEGDWYPGQLVADSYFEEYARNLAEECGMVDTSASWPMTCIDWGQATLELQTDYSCIIIRGDTYWYC